MFGLVDLSELIEEFRSCDDGNDVSKKEVYYVPSHSGARFLIMEWTGYVKEEDLYIPGFVVFQLITDDKWLRIHTTDKNPIITADHFLLHLLSVREHPASTPELVYQLMKSFARRALIVHDQTINIGSVTDRWSETLTLME